MATLIGENRLADALNKAADGKQKSQLLVQLAFIKNCQGISERDKA